MDVSPVLVVTATPIETIRLASVFSPVTVAVCDTVRSAAVTGMGSMPNANGVVPDCQLVSDWGSSDQPCPVTFPEVAFCCTDTALTTPE